jgi:hypothetical protein
MRLQNAAVQHWPPHSRAQNRPPLTAPLDLQIMRNPQARSNIQSNSKIKIIYDPQSYDSAEDDDGDIQAAMEASLRPPTPPPLALSNTVALFFHQGVLPYSHDIPSGFYACFGVFAEVANKDEVPSLANLRRCPIIEGRDVIVLDVDADPALAGFKQQVQASAPRVLGASVMARVAWVVQLVATRLGGSHSDEELAEQYLNYSVVLQARYNSVALPIGELTVRPFSPQT